MPDEPCGARGAVGVHQISKPLSSERYALFGGDLEIVDLVPADSSFRSSPLSCQR